MCQNLPEENLETAPVGLRRQCVAGATARRKPRQYAQSDEGFFIYFFLIAGLKKTNKQTKTHRAQLLVNTNNVTWQQLDAFRHSVPPQK